MHYNVGICSVWAELFTGEALVGISSNVLLPSQYVSESNTLDVCVLDQTLLVCGDYVAVGIEACEFVYSTVAAAAAFSSFILNLCSQINISEIIKATLPKTLPLSLSSYVSPVGSQTAGSASVSTSELLQVINCLNTWAGLRGLSTLCSWYWVHVVS